MQKVYHFDCPREEYRADACVISCIDLRFDLAVRKFVKRSGIAVYDHVRIPGSVKAIAAPDRDSDRDFVLAMARVSLRLHHAGRLLLFAHNQCGAYGGASAETIAADAVKAAAWFAAAEPTVPIQAFFCDFDGIYSL